MESAPGRRDGLRTTNAATATDQTELADGTVLRYAIIHLPNGQVMTTFVDMTVQRGMSERALKGTRNEALERADQLKRTTSSSTCPTSCARRWGTNIIGFTELLAMPETGAAQRPAA